MMMMFNGLLPFESGWRHAPYLAYVCYLFNLRLVFLCSFQFFPAAISDCDK